MHNNAVEKLSFLFNYLISHLRRRACFKFTSYKSYSAWRLIHEILR